MAKFASPGRQAESVSKDLKDSISSVGTLRNYTQALTRVAEHLSETKSGSLREITPEKAEIYLAERSQEVGQKTLDMERQALQSMMQNVTSKLEQSAKLDVVKSELSQALESRSYTTAQIAAISNAQTERNSLATQIAHSAGLRAHELLTLQRIDERAPSDRPALDSKFDGRSDTSTAYTVQGKGGLIREVQIPNHLAQRLEERRLEAPRQVTDRGIHYESRYDIAGGKNWSNSFSAASERAIGHSTGAHGIRHSYAQERMNELAQKGYDRDKALETVSQEMGHFRPEITEVYLR